MECGSALQLPYDPGPLGSYPLPQSCHFPTEIGTGVQGRECQKGGVSGKVTGEPGGLIRQWMVYTRKNKILSS